MRILLTLSGKNSVYNFRMFRKAKWVVGLSDQKGTCIFLLSLALICSPLITKGQGKTGRDKGKASREAAAIASVEAARAQVLTENFGKAIAGYAGLLQKDSANITLSAEFAYALALDGIYDAALARLDRVWNPGGNSPDVNFFASQVFALMGYGQMAEEFWKGAVSGEVPSWIASRATELLARYGFNLSEAPARDDDVVAGFRRANRLAAHDQNLQAIALFEEIVLKYPGEYLPYVGYSIALERAGLFEPSVENIAKAITIVGDSPEREETRDLLNRRLSSVRARLNTSGRQAATAGSLIKNLPVSDGRKMMFYVGGMYTESYQSLNARYGTYKTGLGSSSIDVGLSSFGGSASISLGLTNYYRHRVFVSGFGFNSTLASGSFAFYLKISVGLSFMNDERTASWDIFLDGQQPVTPKGLATTVGMSVGRSVYFGKR